jgi:mono/diheme cytochrome c family protein
MKPSIKHPAVKGLLVVIIFALIVAGAAAFVYSGVYNIGADAPHSRPVLALLQTLRARSITVHARSLVVPDLSDPTLVLKGAGQYAAMCTQCHLAPGMKNSEIRPGLYPQPPNLTTARIDPREAFWVIKHGIKMSAMPAWGGSHDDATIWSMVAFLQKLPELSPAQYKAIVAKAPPDDDMDMDGDKPAADAGGSAHIAAGSPGQPQFNAPLASPDSRHHP